MQPTMSSTPAAELITDQLEIPSVDDRSYRIIRLPNALEVLLVHDKDTDKASAALDVGVGNFSDPEDMPGVAHAVEHTLFMGTEKYPVENDYAAYLSAHGGYTNAYTSATHTNFFFEISALPIASGASATEKAGKSALEGAIDRFAQFFICPLFLEETLDRELRAVDSENKKNLQSDYWRLNQLSKALANPKHPYCHFSTGNLQTLRDSPKERGINVRDVFMDFHKRFYSANRMKLVILGRETLEELEEWAVKYFSDVSNTDLPENRWDDVEILTSNETQVQYFAKPVMESRTLELYFPYPDEDPLYKTHPSRYLSHLIGHEGPGSILAYIKAKGWANSLSSGSATLCPGTGLFTIFMRLTPEGLKVYPEIVKVIFQYISLIKETPPQEWIVEEMKGMAEVDFRFRQKIKASKFTSTASSLMQKPVPREWLLSAQSLIRNFDADAISKALSYLTPDSFRMAIVSQDYPVKLDKQEKWYGTEYFSEKIPEKIISEIRESAALSKDKRIPELFLPHKNEFIPKALEVTKKTVEKPAIAPTLIKNENGIRIWWKKDDRFWVPKAKASITIRNDFSASSPASLVKTSMYTMLVTDALNEYAYDAEIAGLAFELSLHPAGIDLELDGYSDKMPVLLEKVLLTMRDLEINPQRFEILKERLHRSHRNFDFQQPYDQVSSYMSWLNSPTAFINDDLLAELPSLTLEDVQAFFPQLLQHVHLEVLCHGNLHKEDALQMAKLSESILKPRPLISSQWKPRRSFLLPVGTNVTYSRKVPDPANVNNAIEYVLSVGARNDRDLETKIGLLAQMSHEPAFDQLRTKEQLGYVVFALPWSTSTRIGYKLIIQSERSAEYLEGRIENFLTIFEKKLEEMSQEEFDGYKQSLINRRREKPRNLGHETDIFWGHITSEYFDFDNAEKQIAALEPLTKPILLDFYKTYISPSSPNRSKISVHLCAQKSAPPPSIPDSTTLTGVLSQFLTSQNPSVLTAVKSDALKARLDKEFPSPSADTKQESTPAGQNAGSQILAALRAYLAEDEKLDPASKIDDVLAQATAVLQSLRLGADEDSSAAEAAPSTEAAKPALQSLEDVTRFKAGLQVSEAAAPVVDILSFVEDEAKL